MLRPGRPARLFSSRCNAGQYRDSSYLLLSSEDDCAAASLLYARLSRAVGVDVGPAGGSWSSVSRAPARRISGGSLFLVGRHSDVRI